MSLEIKQEFIKQVQDRRHENPDQLILLVDGLFDEMTDWVATFFVTRHQPQGLRLTNTGYGYATASNLPVYRFAYPEKTHNLSFLLNVSKYMPVPFYIMLDKHNPEICVFDARISSAITLSGGLAAFISGRKSMSA